MYQDQSIVEAAPDPDRGQDWQALAAVIAAAVRNGRAGGEMEMQAGRAGGPRPRLR